MTEVKFDQEKFDLQMKAFQNNFDNLSREVENLKSKSPAEIAEFEKKFATLQENVNAMATIDGKSINEYVTNMQKQLDEQAKQIKEFGDMKGMRRESTQDNIIKLIKSPEFIDAVKSQRNAQFQIKAANDLLTSDWTADTGTVGLPQFDIPGVTRHPWKATPLYASITKRSVGMEHELRYTEELSRSDAAATKAEGSQYAQSGATWIARKLDFFDVGHITKHTRENMEDAQYLQEALNDLLYNGLLRKLEYKLVHGVGTTDISGLHQVYAKAFAKPTGFLSITNPTIADVLRVAKLQVAKGDTSDAEKQGYMANIAILGPATRANMELEKDALGRTLLIGEPRPAGMTILESMDITETDVSQAFIVGDFSKAEIYMKRNIIIETGLDGNDFSYGMMTMRASVRCNLLVKNLQTYAFVKGDFANLPAGISA